MKRSELEEIIEEELYKYMIERTVASRNPPRKMSGTAVSRRDQIGKTLKQSPKAVKYFKSKFGGDWEYYLWAAATNKALKGKE